MSAPYYRDLQPLELVTIVTPFGVRFWDAATESAVGSGLQLEAWPEDAPRLRRRATLNRSGVHTLRDLPGLAAVERPLPGADPASPPISRRFVMEVRDHQDRFLPAVFQADLPYRGLFPTASTASPSAGTPLGFYLFSAATRPTAGLAVVRAELAEFASGQPAAYGVLEVLGPDITWYGVADATGAATVMFSYPPFGPTPPTSPPRPAAVAHLPQRWPVTVRVRYEPGARVIPPGASLPSLASIFAQAPALLHQTATSPGATELVEDLIFGSELLLASAPLTTLLVG